MSQSGVFKRIKEARQVDETGGEWKSEGEIRQDDVDITTCNHIIYMYQR